MVQINASSERPLAKTLVLVTMLAVLMSIFLHYFFKNEDLLRESGFNQVAQLFNSKVNMVRSQWMMDKQPVWVEVKSYDDDGEAHQQKVKVNKRGWIDSEATQTKCNEIWRDTMESPMIFLNLPISAILINEESQSYCRYQIESGEYFLYFPINGKVTFVNLY